MLTEQRNPRTADIDQLSTIEILRVMNTEDAGVASAVREALPAIAEAVDVVVERLRSGGTLIYAGAGTSGRLAMLDAVELVPTFGTSPDLVRVLIAGGKPALTRAIEGAEDNREAGRAELRALGVTGRDVVVGLAASGFTPYVVGVLEAAGEVGAKTIAVACNAPAPLLERADIKIVALVGPEVIAGSTRLKAGTAQKLILNMISTASMIRLGKVYSNLMVDVQVTNEKLARRGRHIVAEIVGVDLDRAQLLLEQSNQEVKTAIVVGLLGISADEARQRLAEHQGILREVIG